MNFATRRENILAIALGIMITVWGLWETVGQTLLQPLYDSGAAVHALSAEKIQLEQESAAIERAMQNLQEFARKSLPSETGAAAVAYQGWLISLLSENSIQSAIVTPAPAVIDAAIGHRIPFSIQCSAPAAAIARFLDQFYAAPLLHRITNLSISGTAEGSGLQRVVISIEALSLNTAERDLSLPSPGVVPDDESLATWMSGDNMFCRKPAEKPRDAVVAAKPEPARPKRNPRPRTEPVRADPGKSIRFVASVWNGKEREAWFIDQRSHEELSVAARSTLKFPGVDGTVHFVGEDILELELDGKLGRLRLGQTLQQLTGVQQ